MSYLEIVRRALKGRTVNAASKIWGIPQPTLYKYTNGSRLPDYRAAALMADEAGISYEEMMKTLVEEETKMKTKTDKLSASFESLLRAANACWIRFPHVA